MHTGHHLFIQLFQTRNGVVSQTRQNSHQSLEVVEFEKLLRHQDQPLRKLVSLSDLRIFDVKVLL